MPLCRAWDEKVTCLKEVPLIQNHEWEKFLLRLKREVTVWRGIRHPNAVELLGWTSQMAGDKIRVSLISTWCDGGDIKDYLRSNPTADRRSLIADVWRGMAYLHSPGIVHGDIKPTNSVVMKDINLAKLRLSSILGDLSTYTQSTNTFVTIRFLSPELLTGVLEARNEGSDVWAFGCASGEVGFLRSDEAGTYQKILKILCDERPYHWIPNDWLVPSAITKDPPYIWPDPDSFTEYIASCFQVDPEDLAALNSLSKLLERTSGIAQSQLRELSIGG